MTVRKTARMSLRRAETGEKTRVKTAQGAQGHSKEADGRIKAEIVAPQPVRKKAGQPGLLDGREGAGSASRGLTESSRDRQYRQNQGRGGAGFRQGSGESAKTLKELVSREKGFSAISVTGRTEEECRGNGKKNAS